MYCFDTINMGCGISYVHVLSVWVVLMRLPVFVYNCSSQYCGVSIHSLLYLWGRIAAWPPRVLYQCCIIRLWHWHTQLCGALKMFVLVVTVVLSVSFCPSDGCEGQSLLAVSQNGLSLSLASLFSGICRLDGWGEAPQIHTDCLLWLCSCQRKLMAPLQTENCCL